MNSNIKILLVDDNPDFLENMRAIFTGAGYQVETAVSAEDALVKINSGYKLIITDFRMPGMDGLAFLKSVKSRFPSIPVIIVTGYSSEEIISEAMRNGVINFFEKPFSALDLLAYTETVLKQFGEQRELPAEIKELFVECSRSISLESREKILDWLPELIIKDVLAFGLCREDELLGVSTALIEAVANALYHGNFEIKSDIRNDGSLEGQKQFKNQVAECEKNVVFSRRRININYSCTAEMIQIRVTDEGSGFDWRKFIGKPFSLYSGKGIFLIHSLVDKAEYNEKGNELTLTKYLKRK